MLALPAPIPAGYSIGGGESLVRRQGLPKAKPSTAFPAGHGPRGRAKPTPPPQPPTAAALDAGAAAAAAAPPALAHAAATGAADEPQEPEGGSDEDVEWRLDE